MSPRPPAAGAASAAAPGPAARGAPREELGGFYYGKAWEIYGNSMGNLGLMGFYMVLRWF